MGTIVRVQWAGSYRRCFGQLLMPQWARSIHILMQESIKRIGWRALLLTVLSVLFCIVHNIRTEIINHDLDLDCLRNVK